MTFVTIQALFFKPDQIRVKIRPVYLFQC